MSEQKNTTVYDQYLRGTEYKRRINLYSAVDENYRYFQGNQWAGVKANGLPTPVFNVIKPIINYKIANIAASDAKIVYKSTNINDAEAQQLSEVADVLTKYAGQLYERTKMDSMSEQILKEAAITGNGLVYFYYSQSEGEVKGEIIDVTNVYPQNPNDNRVQSQESIIISFRRSVESVRREAKANGFSDVNIITGDTDTGELAGDKSKIEVDDHDMCIVLLKFWKDEKTGNVWFKKSVKNTDIVKDTDTGLKYYPLAMMTWEEQKNCFFGISDVAPLISNQDYINTIASMIMYATTYTAFPKMVYDENVVDNPSNDIGEAIAVNGANQNIKNVIDFITPGSISADAFNMFQTTLQQTKELAGANDGALGNINPEAASGKSILAVAEQSAIPLESIRGRFYSFLEDVALIWSDMWRVYSQGGKEVSFENEDGITESYMISAEAFSKLMLSIRIDVGATNRYSELAVMQTLDNLLMNGMIPFEWWVQLQPDSSGLPKAKLTELIEQQKQQAAMQQTAPPSDSDIDAILDSMTPEQQSQAIDNPEYLQEYISGMNDSTSLVTA